METAKCTECDHTETAADALSVGMLITFHRGEAHETEKDRRMQRAAATTAKNPYAWYEED